MPLHQLHPTKSESEASKRQGHRAMSNDAFPDKLLSSLRCTTDDLQCLFPLFTFPWRNFQVGPHRDFHLKVLDGSLSFRHLNAFVAKISPVVCDLYFWFYSCLDWARFVLSQTGFVDKTENLEIFSPPNEKLIQCHKMNCLWQENSLTVNVKKTGLFLSQSFLLRVSKSILLLPPGVRPKIKFPCCCSPLMENPFLQLLKTSELWRFDNSKEAFAAFNMSRQWHLQPRSNSR